MCPRTIRKPNARQLEFDDDIDPMPDSATSKQSSDDELMRRIDKVIDDTIKNVRPYLNRMVKDVERQLEGSFIRTPGTIVLDDMIEELRNSMQRFVSEAKALKRWSQPHPPHSSSKNIR